MRELVKEFIKTKDPAIGKRLTSEELRFIERTNDSVDAKPKVKSKKND